VKSDAFYEEHATDKTKKYFYAIDLQGRVFLEEVQPKNIATSLKSNKILDFLFVNLQECAERDLTLLPEAVREDYPFVSHCGVERNFLRPADAAIVFHSLQDSDTIRDKPQLYYGGTLHQDFDPSSLAISPRTGRLYHKLVGKGTKLHKQSDGGNYYGLVKSSVAVSLSDQIIPCDDDSDEKGYSLEFVANEVRYPIVWLPESAEPGGWAMPFVEG
jgi:hypothetical protein